MQKRLSDFKVEESSRINSAVDEPETYVAINSLQEYNPYENIDRSLIDNLVDESPDHQKEDKDA